MYAFFKKWTPSMANASDSDDVNFVQVEPDSDIAEVIDDCTDQNKEILSMIKKTHLVKDWEVSNKAKILKRNGIVDQLSNFRLSV